MESLASTCAAELAAFDAEWNRCLPWVEAAIRRMNIDTHTAEDIQRHVLAKRFQMWPGRKSVAITELVSYPRLRACNVFLAGGNLKELVEMGQSIIPWARDGQGCARLTWYGRPGWARVFRDMPGGLRSMQFMSVEV